MEKEGIKLSQLTENLNNHQGQADQPSLTALELKKLFDKAPNDIKDYLNGTLLPELENIFANVVLVTEIVNDLSAGGSNVPISAEAVQTLNNTVTTLSTTVNNISTSVNGLKSGAKTTITSGTANPSGGSNGDIYIQYFN